MLLHAGINTSTRLVSVLLPESTLPGFETSIYAIMVVSYGFVALVLLAATSGRLIGESPAGTELRPN